MTNTRALELEEDAPYTSPTSDPLERLAAWEEADELVDIIFAGGIHRAVSEYADGKKPVDTLQDFFQAQTVATLRDTLAKAGVPQVPKGPKGRLVQMAMDVLPDDLRHFSEILLPFGRERLQEFRTLLEQGGRVEVLKQDLHGWDDVVLPFFPLILLFDTGSSFVSVIPQEVRMCMDQITRGDWEYWEQQADLCDELLDHVFAATNLRGIVELDQMLGECFGERLIMMDDDTRNLLESTLSPGPWFDSTGIEHLYNDANDVNYLVSESLAKRIEHIESDAEVDRTLDDIIARQALVPARPVTDEHLHHTTVYSRALACPQGHALLAALDARTPVDVSQRYFALDVILDIVANLRTGDDVQHALDAAMRGQELVVQGDLAHELYDLAEALNRIIPKWELNGWSHTEVDELRHDTSFWPQGKPDPSLDYTPTAPRDFSTDEFSGYAWAPTERDDIFAQLQGDDRVAPEHSEESASGTAASWLGPYWAEDKDLVAFVAAYPDGECENLQVVLHERNEKHLDEFDAWLAESGLKDQTINRHLSNVNPFINYYLADYDARTIKQGVDDVGSYLGNFFIRKMMWSTPATIRSTAASIKKFYRCMCELGYVTKPELDTVMWTIKQELPSWCDTCEQYNDPYGENPFNWWD